MGFRWPWAKPKHVSLSVDFGAQPLLPQGTVSVARHIPAASGQVILVPGDLVLTRMPARVTYADYYREHAQKCCDGLVLDAIFRLLVAGRPDPRHVIRTLFGEFWGQIFFLGSSFAARDGGAECVGFLNVETAHITGMPAIRYSTFSANPVRPDVPVFSCHLR